MCLHDEAAPHYIDMIDHTTLGYRFIKRDFGQIPRIEWQIDPFGHSAVQAFLLGAEVGFDFLFFGRIDYQDRGKQSKKVRKVLRLFGVVLRPLVLQQSSSLKDNAHLFYYNVQEKVNDFVAAAVSQAARQLEYFKGRSSLGPNTDALADALAIAQHHDTARELFKSSLACLVKLTSNTGTGCEMPKLNLNSKDSNSYLKNIAQF
ncbi:hypothetical protein GIB67_007150 [Kingdonia uniflora]|uniref:Glycoside hydrolase family 38 N-terminal domain-containing protein n=1 Tax=Kingdonia uniflora TaxID=39325 RepID=A0A7J7MLE4_9MAGN|nr:hypothetical protein GIB67_007150 [Kingdonia uniflora]